MKFRTSVLLLVAACGGARTTSMPAQQIPPAPAPIAAAPAFTYPETKKGTVVDDYHGTKVADPYRWLEDPDSAETRAWVEAENKLTFSFLDKIPQRPQIKERLTQLWNYERWSAPVRRGDRYFWSKNDGLQNQAVVYVASGPEAEPKVLFDPNKLSADGTVALNGMTISEDGRLAAYGLASAGSDWVEWRIRDVETGRDLDDLIRWTKSDSVVWTKDGKGFYYDAFDPPKPGQELTEQNFNDKLFYHRLGTEQAADTLVMHRPEHKEWFYWAQISEDGRYLVVSVARSTNPENRVFYRELGKKGGAFKELISDFTANYAFIDHAGGSLFFRSNDKAPRGKIVAYDLAKKTWRTVVPEGPDMLTGAGMLDDKLVLDYLQDAHSSIRFATLDG